MTLIKIIPPKFFNTHMETHSMLPDFSASKTDPQKLDFQMMSSHESTECCLMIHNLIQARCIPIKNTRGTNNSTVYADCSLIHTIC